MSKNKLLILIALAVLISVVGSYVILRLPNKQTKTATVAVSPEFVETQVAKKVTASYPHVVISPGKSEKPGETIYEVRLPQSEARDLPRLHACLSRVYAEYRQQGFKGKYLIYLGDRVIQSVP